MANAWLAVLKNLKSYKNISDIFWKNFWILLLHGWTSFDILNKQKMFLSYLYKNNISISTVDFT